MAWYGNSINLCSMWNHLLHRKEKIKYKIFYKTVDNYIDLW